MPEYDYNLPQELIAQTPADPRDSSRLFVYDTTKNEIIFDVFKNISKYIPTDSLLVLNDTKVVPARLELTKKTGGTVRILFLFNEWDRGRVIKGLPDRKINLHEELCDADSSTPIIKAISHVNEEFTFELKITGPEFEILLEKQGRTPLPPYIDSNLNEEQRRERYQTVFANKSASVAAPTASLHFTDEVFISIKKKGIQKTTITLDVGRGTFSPVTDGMQKENKLHVEPINISKEAATEIQHAKIEKRTVVAAGTTTLRTLESAADSILKGEAFEGETNIFIRPPYNFKVVDALITNFHLPQTSLLMLLDAFLQAKGAKKSWKELYEMAIREKLRFYSFGDAMLII